MEDTVFPCRFRHVPELQKFGADIQTAGSCAIIKGVDRLHPAKAYATDLRGGAAMMLSGLAAEGETILRDPAGHIARGYEDLPGMLGTLGADIITEA
jgi:UDP-N-acetylglucosamine 1-carboxyvinyltransferase